MKHPQKYDAIVVTSLHPLFRSILWAAQARSTDETRICLQYLHFVREGKVCKIVATDGRRMHVGTYDPGLLDDDIAAIETGNYEVVAKSSKVIVLTRDDEEEISYPNWRKILPPEYGYRERTLSLSRDNVALIGIRFERLLATDFVHQACGFGAGFGKDETIPVIVRDHGEGALVEMQHELGTAYVMPMRFDNEDAAPASEIDATPEFLKKTAELVDQVETWSVTKAKEDSKPVDDDDPQDGPTIIDVDGEASGKKYVNANEVLALCQFLVGKATAAEKNEALITFANDYGLHGLQMLEGGISNKVGKELREMLQELIANYTDRPTPEY